MLIYASTKFKSSCHLILLKGHRCARGYENDEFKKGIMDIRICFLDSHIAMVSQIIQRSRKRIWHSNKLDISNQPNPTRSIHRHTNLAKENPNPTNNTLPSHLHSRLPRRPTRRNWHTYASHQFLLQQRNRTHNLRRKHHRLPVTLHDILVLAQERRHR